MFGIILIKNLKKASNIKTGFPNRCTVMRGRKKVEKSTYVFWFKCIFSFFLDIWIVYFQNLVLIERKLIFFQSFKVGVNHTWNLSSHIKCMEKQKQTSSKFSNMSTHLYTFDAIFILKIFLSAFRKPRGYFAQTCATYVFRQRNN